MIRSLDQMVDKVLALKKTYRIAVAWAHDSNTLGAVNNAVACGFAEAILLGKSDEIKRLCSDSGIDHHLFTLIETRNETEAASEAVRLAVSGDADVVMKGLVSSDKFLKAVMDREKGLMIPDVILSYVGAVEIPSYHKLLFITDPAVIPFPDLAQKTSMAQYAIEMTARFGIQKPKIALISATEKISRHFPSSGDYLEMIKMAESGHFGNCIMDGPLDIFLACDKKSVEIKGITTPVNGDADILLFPSLESSNPFYKGLMLFAQGQLAGLLRGTQKPVILMSRSESEKSKFYCIALSCLMA